MEGDSGFISGVLSNRADFYSTEQSINKPVFKLSVD